MSRKTKTLLALAAAALVAVAAISFQVDDVSWRAVVLKQKATGELQDVSWSELLTMLRPGSGVYLRGLVDTPNPYAVIANPFNSAADIKEGKRLFEAQCMHCHGAAGDGGTAPNIVSESLRQGDSDWATYRTLKDGIQGTAMVPANLADADRWRVTGYVLALRRSHKPGDAKATNFLPEISVPYERILNARSEPQNWLSYSGAYNGQRHTILNNIGRTSLDRMGLRWVVQTEAKERIEATPIVADGVMYLSLPEGTVLALNAETGDQYWRWDAVLDDSLPVCCGRVNRGVAILDDKIFVATLDNRLHCLDAASGRLLWEQRIADSRDGYTITVAPLAVKDKVIVGVSGGEFGIRGFLDAYDASSGKRAWRFFTIPEPGKPGNDTWADESWRTGGGPTWVTGSFDPALNLLYWGVGNPSPDFDGSARAGDNLYTNSVIALDIDTGELGWHFQFTPHDVHDYDSNQVPVLVDQPFNGRVRSLMLWANRNGFFYVLDRATGSFLGSVPFAKQTWAEKIDEFGRPVKSPSSAPSPKGTLVWPGGTGATNWPPPSFNPSTGLFYVVRLNRPSIYFNHETPEERKSGEFWWGGTTTLVADSSETSVVAIDPRTPAVVWERHLPDVGERGRFSGVLTSAELALVGAGKSVYALDAVSGEVLWSSNLGGEVGSPPISFLIGNTQFVTIAAGRNIYTFGVEAEKKLTP